MEQDRNDRMKKFENAIGQAIDPQITKFAPKIATEATVASVTQNIREQAQLILKMCDEADAAITASEEHARKAADALMDMIRRVK